MDDHSFCVKNTNVASLKTFLLKGQLQICKVLSFMYSNCIAARFVCPVYVKYNILLNNQAVDYMLILLYTTV